VIFGLRCLLPFRQANDAVNAVIRWRGWQKEVGGWWVCFESCGWAMSLQSLLLPSLLALTWHFPHCREWNAFGASVSVFPVPCSPLPVPCSCPSSFVLVQGCVRKFITGKGTWNTFAWKLPPPHSHIYFDWCAGTKSPRIKYGSSTLKRSLNYLPKHPEMLVIPTVWSGQDGKRVMFEDQWAWPHLAI